MPDVLVKPSFTFIYNNYINARTLFGENFFQSLKEHLDKLAYKYPLMKNLGVGFRSNYSEETDEYGHMFLSDMTFNFDPTLLSAEGPYAETMNNVEYTHWYMNQFPSLYFLHKEGSILDEDLRNDLLNLGKILNDEKILSVVNYLYGQNFNIFYDFQNRELLVEEY